MADNKSKRKNIFIACIVLCVLCFIAYYFFNANICHEGESACLFETTPVGTYFLTTFLAQLGNAGLVFSLLWYFGAPAVKKIIKDRRDNLEREIRESARLKQEAETVCNDAEQKMDRLEGEVKELTKSYSEAADIECKQIAENAVAAAERIKQDAESSFELQSNVARSAFEKELMAKAIEQARNEIAAKIAGDNNLKNKLIDQSIASLEL